MTRTDWGEGLTYNGPLNVEFYLTWSDDSLVEHIHQSLFDFNDTDPHIPSELVDFEIERLGPKLDALERKALTHLENIAQVREQIASWRKAKLDLSLF